MSDIIFNRFSGNSFDMEVRIKDSNGAAIDLSSSGATARLAIGEGGSPINESTSGVTIDIDEPNGLINIWVTAAAMAACTNSEYPISLDFSYTDGSRETLFTGVIVFQDGVR